MNHNSSHIIFNWLLILINFLFHAYQIFSHLDLCQVIVIFFICYHIFLIFFTMNFILFEIIKFFDLIIVLISHRFICFNLITVYSIFILFQYFICCIFYVVIVRLNYIHNILVQFIFYRSLFVIQNSHRIKFFNLSYFFYTRIQIN